MGQGLLHEDRANAVRELAQVAFQRSSEIIEQTLVAAMKTLDMDVAFVSEFTEGQMIFRAISGDAASFGWRKGLGLPLENTYCRHVLSGNLPNVVPDARNDYRVNDLAVTREANIGSYVGVPMWFSDGSLCGMLCSLSHSPGFALQERDAAFMHVLARLVSEQLERQELESENRRLEVRSTGVGALLAALEARDGYTGEHSRYVVKLSTIVGRRMGLSEEEVADVEQAALLHDVGKVGTPDTVLKKRGRFTREEWEVMREHPITGEYILSSIDGLAHLAPIVRATHERWDGEGYPDGLSGKQIPLASRIVFACDGYHAMISDRPYREALDVQVALEELQEHSGTQFCPYTVPVLLSALNHS